MARLGGAAGAAPDVRHQPPGTQFTYTTNSHLIASTLVAQRSRQLASMHEVIGSRPAVIFFGDILNFWYIPSILGHVLGISVLYP